MAEDTNKPAHKIVRAPGAQGKMAEQTDRIMGEAKILEHEKLFWASPELARKAIEAGELSPLQQYLEDAEKRLAGLGEVTPEKREEADRARSAIVFASKAIKDDDDKEHYDGLEKEPGARGLRSDMVLKEFNSRFDRGDFDYKEGRKGSFEGARIEIPADLEQYLTPEEKGIRDAGNKMADMMQGGMNLNDPKTVQKYLDHNAEMRASIEAKLKKEGDSLGADERKFLENGLIIANRVEKSGRDHLAVLQEQKEPAQSHILTDGKESPAKPGGIEAQALAAAGRVKLEGREAGPNGIPPEAAPLPKSAPVKQQQAQPQPTAPSRGGR